MKEITSHFVKTVYNQEMICNDTKLNSLIEILKENQAEQARKIFDLMVEVRTEQEAFILRSEFYFKIAEYRKCIDDCTEALGQDEGQMLCFQLRSLAYFMQEKYQQSIQDISHAIKLSDPYWKLINCNIRSNIYQSQQDYDLALIDLEEIRKLKTELFNYQINSNVHHRLVMIIRKFLFKGWEVNFFPDEEDILFRKAKIEFLQKKYAGSIEGISRLIDKFPEKAKYFKILAYLYIKTGENHKAGEYLYYAKRIDPFDAQTLAIQAGLHKKQGDLDNSISSLRKAIELAPHNRIYQSAIYYIEKQDWLDNINVFKHPQQYYYTFFKKYFPFCKI